MPLVQPQEVWIHPGGDASPKHEFIYFVFTSELQGWTEARAHRTALSQTHTSCYKSYLTLSYKVLVK